MRARKPVVAKRVLVLVLVCLRTGIWGGVTGVLREAFLSFCLEWDMGVSKKAE
jgi:hypothetical protein